MQNCKQQPVALPAIVKTEDLGVRSGKWGAAASEGNERIEAGNACIDAIATMNGGAGRQ